MSGYLLKKCGGREDAPAINGYVPAVGWESIVFIGVFASFFAVMGSRMGAVNMVNTMMNTAYRLLQDTVFYIMAIAVLAGAISGLLTEFGVVALINRLLSSLMESPAGRQYPGGFGHLSVRQPGDSHAGRRFGLPVLL